MKRKLKDLLSSSFLSVTSFLMDFFFVIHFLSVCETIHFGSFVCITCSCSAIGKKKQQQVFLCAGYSLEWEMKDCLMGTCISSCLLFMERPGLGKDIACLS